jgi:hypothetical protein
MWIILINNQHLMEKSAFLGLFDNEMCYNSVTTEPTSKWTLFSCFPWNSAYSSCFSLKNSKIFENRRTIVQRISRFWPNHGFLLKHNCPYQNLMEITKMWTILINNQHLRKKSAFFCFFRQKICNKSSTTEHTPKGPQGLLSMLSFCQSSFLLSTESAGKLGFGLVPSRTSRPPGKGLIARGDLGVTGSVSVTDLTSPVAVLPDDKTVGSTWTVFSILVGCARTRYGPPSCRQWCRTSGPDFLYPTEEKRSGSSHTVDSTSWPPRGTGCAGLGMPLLAAGNECQISGAVYWDLQAHRRTHTTHIPKHGSVILLFSYGDRSKKHPEAPT